MGNTDAIQILVNLANGLQGTATQLALTLGTLFAALGAAAFLVQQNSHARKAPGQASGGKTIAWLLLCGGLAGLDQMIAAGARQLGWQGATFDAISYVDVGTFGTAAQAANAVLSLIRMLGVYFALKGILYWRRSLKDGHTGLSAGEDRNKGWVMFVVGVFCVCNPYLLDALQKSLARL